MFVVQNLLDVQLVLTRSAILRDFMNQHGDFWYRRMHAVQQTQFEWHRDLLEALRPVRFDLPIFDLLGTRYDRSQPLAFNRRCDPVVACSHRSGLSRIVRTVARVVKLPTACHNLFGCGLAQKKEPMQVGRVYTCPL